MDVKLMMLAAFLVQAHPPAIVLLVPPVPSQDATGHGRYRLFLGVQASVILGGAISREDQ